MNRQDVVEMINDMGFDDTIILDNPSFDNSIVGITESGNLVYSYELMIKELAKKDKIDEDESREFIDYNTIRAIPYMQGGSKPIIMYKLEV